MKCNQCGASTSSKKKKPFFLRWWFILLAIIAVIIIALSVGSMGEKVVWKDMVLNEMLPKPPANRGEIHENSADKLWVDINDVSDKQYSDYINACKEKGFTTDAKSDTSSYDAYNAEGYKLSITHYGSDASTSIELEAPMEMNTISWPVSTAGKQLPAPASTIGKFSYEHEDSFLVYVGNTSKEDYTEYVNTCSEKGFNINYDKKDEYYHAENSNGWNLSIRYVGNNMMSIDISAPKKSNANKTDQKKSNSKRRDLDSDFKAAMDSYEKFMNEYVKFMKKYKSNPNDLGLLSDYADYMNKYAEFVEDFEKWEDENLNAAEMAYYIDVQTRVSKKLLKVAD